MNKVPVSIIDKTEESVESISNLLRNISDLEIIKSGTDLGDLEMILVDKIPCMVLLGPSYSLDDIEKILRNNSASFGFVKIVLLVKEPSAALFKKAIKLNIYDVLEFPFTYNDLKESIIRMEKVINELEIESQTKSKASPGKQGQDSISKIITVFSTKGGSGKSFLACNLAVDLLKQSKKRVSLFDLNYLSGDVALILNLNIKNTIYDITTMGDRLDTEMLSSFLNTHESGVKIVPAPINPMQAETISTKATMKVINTLSKISDYTIIDAPPNFSDIVLMILEKTDYLCMIASMDVPSIKNLKTSLEMLNELKLPKGKIITIINRSNSKVGITVEEIESTLERKIDVCIPSDRIVPLMINKGVPVVTEAPRSLITKNINKLSKLIMEPKKN